MTAVLARPAIRRVELAATRRPGPRATGRARPVGVFDAARSRFTCPSGAFVEWVQWREPVYDAVGRLVRQGVGWYRVVPADPNVPGVQVSRAEVDIAVHLSGPVLPEYSDPDVVSELIERVADTVARVGPAKISALDQWVRGLNGRSAQPGGLTPTERRQRAAFWTARRSQQCTDLAFRLSSATRPVRPGQAW